jgi:3-phosphoinositide dependent protein kinase-1
MICSRCVLKLTVSLLLLFLSPDKHRTLKLCDFGTAKVLDQFNNNAAKGQAGQRKASFVGTADYCAPEILNSLPANSSADLWSLGCVLFQFLAGKPPFRGNSEYLTFQKILKGDINWPEQPSIEPAARDLIVKLLQFSPEKRPSYEEIKNHKFFIEIEWETVSSAPAPLPPGLSAPNKHKIEQSVAQNNRNNNNVSDSEEEEGNQAGRGANSPQNGAIQEEKDQKSPKLSSVAASNRSALIPTADDTQTWSKFLSPNEIIIYSGRIIKRRGLFAKKRQLILTNQPRFIYVDPVKMEFKKQIEWTATIWAEWKDEKTFYIHTDKRSYYMVALTATAAEWVRAISRLKQSLANTAIQQ